MKVASASEMSKLDNEAVETYGIDEEILMENAGLAVSYVIEREFGFKGKKFSVVCGVGNNGGDGFVVARKLHSNGGRVEVILTGSSEKIGGSAGKNFKRLSNISVPVHEAGSKEEMEDLLKSSDGLVDSIFGTGLTRNIEGFYKEAIDSINSFEGKVFSVDMPSGVGSDNGRIMGVAVEADCTVTFGLPKIGNLVYPGHSFSGKLYVSHISFPPSLYTSDSLKTELYRPPKIPKRMDFSHKGDYGKALFVSGSVRYIGAPYFSSMSFLKAGGGLSYLATPRSVSSFIAGKGSEIVLSPLKETESGTIAKESKKDILEKSRETDMVALGPGVSLNEETQSLCRELVAEIDKPLLIDGDGLTALAKDTELLKKRDSETILTPHPGEMSRLTGRSVEEIQNDRVNILRETSKRLDSIIVLKEANSLIGYPNGKVYINTSGNPGMATAGSGDVLTGTIFGIKGLGLSLNNSVPLGVFIHGLSGDLAAEEKGEDGVTAQDILDYIPSALDFFRKNREKISENFYGSIRPI